MRLSLSVNGRHTANASLERKGWLGAHISLSQGLPDNEPDRVWINAIDVTEEPNTTHSGWEAVPLVVGDKIMVDVLPDGESDPPSEVRHTSDSPKNLFGDVKNALSLLDAIKACDKALTDVLHQAQASESPEELREINLAIGSIVVEMDRQLITPTIRRHPALLARAQELGIR
jgi:hypothetical protein